MHNSITILIHLLELTVFRKQMPISTRWNLLDSLHHLLNPALVGLGFFVIVHADKEEVSRVMLQGRKIFFFADLVYCGFGGIISLEFDYHRGNIRYKWNEYNIRKAFPGGHLFYNRVFVQCVDV